MNKELETLRAERDSLRAALVRLTVAVEAHRNALTIPALNELCDAEDQARAFLAINPGGNPQAVATNLLEALKSVVAGYQQLFDSMPVAWETYDYIAREAIVRAEFAGILAPLQIQSGHPEEAP